MSETTNGERAVGEQSLQTESGVTQSPHGVAGDTHDAAKRPWLLRSGPYGWFLIITSIIGFLSSFELSIDKVRKLENPNAVLSCDFNPFFSCGNVMAFPQSQLFGFPNQFLGIMAFTVPLIIAVLLLSGTTLPRWFMVMFNIGLALGVVFVMFLFYTSIYAIGIGCPWCIVVWSVTIPMFCVTTGRNVLDGTFGYALQHNSIARVLAKESLLISIIWVFVIYACIVIRFWTYFSTFVS